MLMKFNRRVPPSDLSDNAGNRREIGWADLFADSAKGVAESTSETAVAARIQS